MHEHPAGLLDRVLHVRDVRGAMPLVEVRRVVPGKECCETAHLLILPKDGWWSSVVVDGRRWSLMGWRPPSHQRATATYAAIIRCGHPDGAGGNVCGVGAPHVVHGTDNSRGHPRPAGPPEGGFEAAAADRTGRPCLRVSVRTPSPGRDASPRS